VNSTLMRTALRGSQEQIRHVRVVRPGAARGVVAATYAQVERDFGMLAPPVSLHAPAPGPLAACWLMLRETLLASGLAGRPAKETVATVVSASNTCPYCVAVHGATLRRLGDERDAAAVADGVLDAVADPGTRDIAAWARASGIQELAAHHPVPFPAEHSPELVGVAVTFQYLNRMVNVFLPDGPLPAQVPAAVRGRLMRLLGRFMGRMASQHVQPGAALELLPDAPLPPDLAWAAGHRTVSGALARAAAAIDAAGRRCAAEPVRELVLAELAQWDGHPPGPSRAYADDAVSRLRPPDRPAGRLALLTALASYQVGQSDIDAFRLSQPGDEPLIALTSWASLAAARRVGSWMTVGPAQSAQHGHSI
jgi:AhpD family alkylhydroperoxidase